ncbi:NERD domain-containing protein, partial [candidate division WS5 bacterium]
MQFTLTSANGETGSITEMEKKSPLKGKPLRYVGQSLDERIHKLINEDGVPYIAVGVLMIYLMAHEWWRYFSNPPPTPIAITIIASIFVIYAAYKLYKIKKEVKSIRLGRDGERVVGQYLDGLREKGHRIFHDLIGGDGNFNLDHVIISRKGIYVIETKTYSKPASGQTKIWFDGEKLTI